MPLGTSKSSPHPEPAGRLLRWQSQAVHCSAHQGNERLWILIEIIYLGWIKRETFSA